MSKEVIRHVGTRPRLVFGGADFQLVIKWGVETWPKKSLRFHATFKMISDCQLLLSAKS